LQDPPKFTQIWIFGLKTSHLATLRPSGRKKGMRVLNCQFKKLEEKSSKSYESTLTATLSFNEA
jgi:hypothetical protein